MLCNPNKRPRSRRLTTSGPCTLVLSHSYTPFLPLPFAVFPKVDRRHPPTREFRAIILKDAVDNNRAVLSELGGRESQSSVRRHGNRAPRRHGREAFPSFALLPVHPAVLQGPGGQGPGQVRGNEATPKRQNKEANHKADKTPRGSIGNA